MRRQWLLIGILFALLAMGTPLHAQDATPSPYEIALQRIEEARASGVSVVNLAYLDLTELPLELWQLDYIQQLNLNSNQLTTLPPEIGQLTQLQTLYLMDNQLASLPASL